MDKSNEIELLQAQLIQERALVQDLEAGKSKMILDAIEVGGQFSDLREAVRVLKEVLQFVMLKAPGYDWNTDPLSITLMVGNAFTKSNHVLAGEPDEENDSLQSQLTQRTVELHETQNHLADADNEVEQLRKQLSERTAELEAAKQKAAEQGRYAVEMFDELKRVQAELERVKGELQSAEAGYFVAERDLQGANNKYDELRTLIAALPKVKGAVEVSAGDDGWYILPLWIRCVTKEQAEGYVALLQHRQGMEG